MLIDDATLIELRQGSDAGWLALANALRAQWAHRTAQAVGQGEADDILQNVFIRLVGHIDCVVDVAHLDCLVARIWSQCVVDWHRRRSKSAMQLLLPPSVNDDGNAASGLEPADADRENNAQRQAIAGELRGILERESVLPAEQRLIVILHVFDSLTLPQIAGRLGQNIKTIETWYRRSLEVLAQQLALQVYRDRAADFEAALSELQKEALDHLLRGLSKKETAKALNLRVRELAALLAPAWEVLGRAARADWLRELQ